MMNYGMPTLIENKTLDENINLCSKLGLSFIELNMNFPEYQIDKIENVEQLKECNARCVIETKTIDALKKSVEWISKDLSKMLTVVKKLIILRGNSGSGKTTIAKELQKEFGSNTMLISQDVIRRDILKVKDGENTLALPLMKELLMYGNRHCEIVIMEGIMYSDWYKTLFELANQLYGDEIYAYYFDISFEETLKRHQTKPNCHEFGKEAMKKWWREKDFSNILKEIAITEEKNMESIVADICNEVLGVRKLV